MTASRNGMLKEKINLTEYPTSIRSHEATQRIVCGDLDGSVIKLMAFLIREGVLQLPQGEERECFNSLVEDYNNALAELDEQTLQSFCENWQMITASEIRPRVLILGDDLCDRGANDLLILQSYKRMADCDIKFDIIASNHGMDFLRQFFSAEGLTGEAVHHYQGYFGQSLAALRISILDCVIAEVDVIELVRQHYLKNMKLLTYDRVEDDIILYTHAPVHPEQIHDLFDALRDLMFEIDVVNPLNAVEFNAHSVESLMASLEQMNTWFLHALNLANENDLVYQKLFEVSGKIDDFVNGRYENLENTQHFGPYSIINVHGHVGDGHLSARSEEAGLSIPYDWKYINLDASLGMRMQSGYIRNRGSYKIYVSTQSPRGNIELLQPMTAPVKPIATRATGTFGAAYLLVNWMLGAGVSSESQNSGVNDQSTALEFKVEMVAESDTASPSLLVTGFNSNIQQQLAEKYVQDIVLKIDACQRDGAIQSVMLDFTGLTNADINTIYEAFAVKLQPYPGHPALRCRHNLDEPSRDWDAFFADLARAPTWGPRR